MKSMTNDILREFEERLGRANPRERRIAVFGPQSSGKTCYFASLYGRSTGDGAAANFDYDSDTADYMSQCWQEYSTGVPGATGKTIPTKLRFQLTHMATGRLWTVEMLDHAGELIERLDRSAESQAGGHEVDDMEWLRDLVSLWLRECEAILIFLDVSDDRGEQLQKRRAEVGRLLSLCSEYSKEDRRLSRPLALVLAKWDCRGPIDRTDPKGEEQRARRFLADDPDFRQISELIEGFGQNVAIFPVSAFGTGAISQGFDAKGRHIFRPAKARPDPYNLLAPLAWAVQQSDARRLQEAERLAAERPGAIEAQIEAFETLIGRDGIINGPIHDAAKSKLKELHARRRSRGLKRVGAIAALALAVVGGGWYLAREKAGYEYEAVRDFRTEYAKISDAPARAERCNQLLGSVWSWLLPAERVTEVTGWVQKDELESRKWRAQNGIAELRLRSEQAKSPEELLALARDAAEYAREFKETENEAEARGIGLKAEAAGKIAQEQYDRYRAHQQLEPTNDPRQAVAHWEKYLVSAPPPIDELRRKAEARRDALKVEAEDTAWAAVDNYARLNPLDFLAIRQRAEGYLREYGRSDTPARHASAATTLLATNAKRWDKKLYNDIREAAAKTDVASLRDAAQKASVYLSEETGPPNKVMRDYVLAWKAWFDTLDRGTNLAVTLKSFTAHKDTDFYRDVNFNGFFLLMKAGIRIGSTDREWKDWSDLIYRQSDSNLEYKNKGNEFKNQENFGGPIPYRLGDSGSVRVLGFQLIGANKKAEVSLPSDQCLPMMLEKGVQLTDGNGQPIYLKFECPLGVPPRLPDHTAP